MFSISGILILINSNIDRQPVCVAFSAENLISVTFLVPFYMSNTAINTVYQLILVDISSKGLIAISVNWHTVYIFVVKIVSLYS